MHDTFYFPDGRLLRTHTSPVQIRAMAEAGADLICHKLGLEAICRTESTPLLPHRAYYH